MSYAISFNLDQSRILSYGNGLSAMNIHTRNGLLSKINCDSIEL